MTDDTNALTVPIERRTEGLDLPRTATGLLDWTYSTGGASVPLLYARATDQQWRAEDLPWSTDVDVARQIHERCGSAPGAYYTQLLQTPRPLSNDDAVVLVEHINGFMLSQFLHGEQGALLGAAQLAVQLPWAAAKQFAAMQAADEARHVEVFRRYLTDKTRVSYHVQSGLEELLRATLTDTRWDITFLGVQIMIEGLALAAFRTMNVIAPAEPLIAEITRRVIQDEARHVAFGVHTLDGLYEREFSSAEIAERETFTIEAIQLLRRRLLMHEVIERIGWKKSLWARWMDEAPCMVAFRQMLFAKIIPNVRRVGLLTPSVRRVCEELGLASFGTAADSLQSPEVALPVSFLKTMVPAARTLRSRGANAKDP